MIMRLTILTLDHQIEMKISIVKVLSIQKVLPSKKFRPKILSDNYLSLLKHGSLSVVRSVSRLIRITRRWRTWCLTAWVKVKTTGWTVGGS